MLKIKTGLQIHSIFLKIAFKKFPYTSIHYYVYANLTYF